jgi:eukaryotic-like serine/threonine-protein kinase
VSPPTEVAGRYLIERRLGAGGMSTVFQARDTVLERAVAVKLLAEHLADDEAFVYRFRREALSAARLQHPNIVQVFDSGQDTNTGRHYIVMEYVDGPSAADMLRERKQLEIDETLGLVRDACHGLDYAHRASVVHRDVKPGNLLFAEEMGITKLADFGIAKAAEQTRITQVGSVLGTAAYLSPEQARGEEAGPASDIYSLGVCAYQFLTGRLPHEYASLTELALKQQQDPVAPVTDYRPEVPRELDEAVRVALERDPDARYSTALEMAEAIEAGTHRGDTAARHERLRRDAGARRHGRYACARAHLARLGRNARAASATGDHAARAQAARGAGRRTARCPQARMGDLPRPAGSARGHRGRGDRAAVVLEPVERGPGGHGRPSAADRRHQQLHLAALPLSTRSASAAKLPASIAARRRRIRRSM